MINECLSKFKKRKERIWKKMKIAMGEYREIRIKKEDRENKRVIVRKKDLKK